MPTFDPVREKNTGFPDMERICPDAAVDGGGSCGGGGISAGILENAAELKELVFIPDLLDRLFRRTIHLHWWTYPRDGSFCSISSNLSINSLLGIPAPNRWNILQSAGCPSCRPVLRKAGLSAGCSENQCIPPDFCLLQNPCEK